MSVHKGRDRHGYYYQWGNGSLTNKKWTKYYYNHNSTKSQANANYKAYKQGLMSKYRKTVTNVTEFLFVYFP